MFPPSAAKIEIKLPHTIFVAAGLPTPFGRGGGALAPAMMLSAYRFLSYGPWPRRTRPCRLGKRDPQPRLEQYRARDLARRQAQSQRPGILCRACVFDQQTGAIGSLRSSRA